MTNEEILEYQRIRKEFQSTELGALFNKFVSLHGRAWQEDERSGWMQSSGRTAKRLWEESDACEKELRAMLHKMVGVK